MGVELLGCWLLRLKSDGSTEGVGSEVVWESGEGMDAGSGLGVGSAMTG